MSQCIYIHTHSHAHAQDVRAVASGVRQRLDVRSSTPVIPLDISSWSQVGCVRLRVFLPITRESLLSDWGSSCAFVLFFLHQCELGMLRGQLVFSVKLMG